MAQLFKKNEKVVLGTYKNGVTLQFFKMTFPSSVAAKLVADEAGFLAGTYTVEQAKSPVAVAFEAISAVASVEIIGVGNGTTEVNFAVAALGGAFGTATWDGANSETFATYLTSLVAATGVKQGVDNANTTVVALVV
jgi:outer membrane lipoprotein SlyB